MNIRIVTYVFLGAALLTLVPSAAGAQDRPIVINVAGGPTLAVGDLGERLATGWGPAVGVTFRPATSPVGFQFEYAYRWFDADEDVQILNSTTFNANHQTHQLDFNVVFNLTPRDSAIRPYIIGGPGAYYRKVEVTEYIGSGIICDPYWYVCGSYPIEDLVGSRGGWDFGFNVGGGIGIGLGEAAEFYVESRYHYVIGPDVPASAAGPGGQANGTYVPISFGFRF